MMINILMNNSLKHFLTEKLNVVHLVHIFPAFRYFLHTNTPFEILKSRPHTHVLFI
jgi:hypothetical protein